MLVKHFPENKRQRQLFVLEGLRKIKSPNKRQLAEIAVLEKRTESNLRHIRTKKVRVL